MHNQQTRRPIAITMGDGAGIGPEIIAQAYMAAPQLLQGCFVVGDTATMRRASACAARARGVIALPTVVLDSAQAALSAPAGVLPVLPLPGLSAPPAYGQLSGESGHFAGECVHWAAQAALRGQVAAMVTAPLHKEAMALGGKPYSEYPGHTELLQAESAVYLNKNVADVPVRMMLANDVLRVVLVSIHVSLQEAIHRLTREAVMETIRITHESLARLLGRQPRIHVAGLNPHAGEGGLFGREELDVIIPAVQAAQGLGMAVAGPFAPDTVFMQARASQAGPTPVDAVIAMYHDQGLIPIKYLGVEEGVNVTLGLPLIRTSPDHGTAFDLAGTGSASEASLLQAVRVARQLAGQG